MARIHSPDIRQRATKKVCIDSIFHAEFCISFCSGASICACLLIFFRVQKGGRKPRCAKIASLWFEGLGPQNCFGILLGGVLIVQNVWLMRAEVLVNDHFSAPGHNQVFHSAPPPPVACPRTPLLPGPHHSCRCPTADAARDRPTVHAGYAGRPLSS